MESAQDQGESRTPRWRTRDLIWVFVFVGIIVVGRVTPFAPVRDFFGSFDWLTRQSLRLANHLFESYGYPTVFFAPLLENTLFLGALVPGTLIMLLAGLGAHDGLIEFWPAILLGIAGAIIGDTISYGMGRYGWQKLGPESRIVRWAEKMREPLLERSIWLVFTYHFAGYSRLVGPAASGFLRMPFRRWMLLDYTGVSLWVTTFITGGYLLGTFGLSLDDSDQNIRVFEIILFAFFIIAVVSVMRAANRSNRQRADEPADAGTAPTPDGATPMAAPALDAAEPASSEEKPEQVR
ncbi:MAG: DedA family protein [Chloroflexi bacterium]|nr:DedA family protein [Chloroflexota bacterium]